MTTCHPYALLCMPRAAVALGASEDGIPFMVVERLQITLAQLLPRDPDAVPFWVQWGAKRRWPLSRALDCGLQLARALAYCHDEAIPGYRVLHRDIKVRWPSRWPGADFSADSRGPSAPPASPRQPHHSLAL